MDVSGPSLLIESTDSMINYDCMLNASSVIVNTLSMQVFMHKPEESIFNKRDHAVLNSNLKE